MVILGLGSNVGDRLANFRNALAALKKLSGLSIQQISPVYLSDALLPDNAPPEWDMPHLNLALRCTTTLAPLDLLDQLKNIEWSIGRKPEIRHWGPRILDIDILAWEDEIIQNERLTVPHASLQERPFALWPLADVAPFWKFPLKGANAGKTAEEIVKKWGSRFSGEAPFRTKQIYQRVETPQLVGIINVTPNSFSDGGQFVNVESALAQAHALIQSGAEILDIGAESTAANAEPVDVKTEWARLEPILKALAANKHNFLIAPKISVDTYHTEVAKKAIELGIDWINDVTGLQDKAMRDLIAQTQVHSVMMHHLTIPASREQTLPPDQDGVKLVYDWGCAQLKLVEKAGIALDKIIFDPGIGFGKTPAQSLALIKSAETFKSLGTKLLIGHSRKSFLATLTAYPPQERDIETLALTQYLAKQQVDFVRIHQVEMCARALRIQAALNG